MLTTVAVIASMAAILVHEQRELGLYVLFITTAAPRQSANSCKHDLSLRSACAFFDRLENKRDEIMGRNTYRFRRNFVFLPFNKAQLEMLDIMANIRSDEELDALKHAVSEFYARRADEEMEKLWQSGKWTEQTLKELGNAHYRTPYRE